MVSGHTLKCITVAIAGFTVCYMLIHRTLKEPEVSRKPSGKAFSVTMIRVAEDSTHVKPINAPIAREFD